MPSPNSTLDVRMDFILPEWSLDYKLNFIRLHPRPHILFYSNGLAIYHGLPDIRPIHINIVGHFEFNQVKKIEVHPPLKTHILFHSSSSSKSLLHVTFRQKKRVLHWLRC